MNLPWFGDWFTAYLIIITVLNAGAVAGITVYLWLRDRKQR